MQWTFRSPFACAPERLFYKPSPVYKLHDVFNEENRCLEYEYDFGASWNHVIQFEGQEEDTSKNGEFPSCVDGRGANRMEDCEDETSDGELKP